MYSKTEIHNLTRFIAAMKFRPLIWRNTHPYILADRVEDISDPEQVRQNPMIDRTISFYGYVHGTHFKRGMRAQVYCRRDYYHHDRHEGAYSGQRRPRNHFNSSLTGSLPGP